jgi:hypothetical protein
MPGWLSHRSRRDRPMRKLPCRRPAGANGKRPTHIVCAPGAVFMPSYKVQVLPRYRSGNAIPRMGQKARSKFRPQPARRLLCRHRAAGYEPKKRAEWDLARIGRQCIVIVHAQSPSRAAGSSPRRQKPRSQIKCAAAWVGHPCWCCRRCPHSGQRGFG